MSIAPENEKLADPLLLRQHVEDICGVSPFFDAEKYYPYSLSGKLNEYLAASRARMEVLLSKFEEMGYTGDVYPWSYYKRPCCNVIFREGEECDHETWIVAHHDYCAGQGADDNASALSVMVETARQIKESGLPVAFASFDLEERGLLGAKHYADSFSSISLRQRIAQMIDLECLGSAPDLFLVDHGHDIVSDDEINAKLGRIAERIGVPLYRGDHCLSFADHVPFAKKGIPATQLCSLDMNQWRRLKGRHCHPRNFGGIAHSNTDVPAHVRVENLLQATRLVTAFLRNSRPC
ncbi:M28 family peptidase [Candidatus Peregrinibacteria bacterium]|nr:M28 family peptidase [Candidatus Peregrinibacteria bacterium]